MANLLRSPPWNQDPCQFGNPLARRSRSPGFGMTKHDTKDRGVSHAASFQRERGSQRRGPVFEDADLVGENVDVEDAPPRRVGYAVEVAADADHVPNFMQKRAARAAAPPGRAWPEGLSATLFPRRKPG